MASTAVMVLAALFGSSVPLGVDAVSLRANPALRSVPAASGEELPAAAAGVSPAELEEEEESPVGPAPDLSPSAIPAEEWVDASVQAPAADIQQASPPQPPTDSTQPAVTQAQTAPPLPPLSEASPPQPPTDSTQPVVTETQTAPPLPPLSEAMQAWDMDRQVPTLAKSNSSLLEEDMRVGQEAQLQAGEAMPTNWPPPGSKHSKCDPPCIKDRGICNDRVCFCKSPYAGNTCQHKITDLHRFSFAIVAVTAVFCLFLGNIIARTVASIIESYRRGAVLEKFGNQKAKAEKWEPPKNFRHG